MTLAQLVALIDAEKPEPESKDGSVDDLLAITSMRLSS